MQKLANIRTCLALLGILLLPSLQPKAAAQDVVVSYQTFYDQLSPYGQWVADPQYGNVWVPNEAPGYRPYGTGGHWAMTSYGNMWVSDAPYGWACYHYGRWTYNPYYGWVWIPGHEWAPAWVSWRSGGGYYGWAPMGPGYNPGGNYEYPDNYWVFVGPQFLYHTNVYSYYEPRYASTYVRQTTYINETYVDNTSHVSYNYGPRSEVIERDTHQPVPVYQVSNVSTPGAAAAGNNSVSVYRPAINTASVSTARPANVVRAEQPVGKPQPIAANAQETRPAFHQDIQKQNPAFSTPNNYEHSPASTPPARDPRNFQSRNPGETPGRPAQMAPAPRPQQFQPAPQQQRPQPNNEPMNRPQPQQFNQPAPAERPQPQNNEQQRPQPQRPQQMNEPQRPQQPMNRPPAQPQRPSKPQRQASPQEKKK